jgi:putative endonuclease
MTTRKQIVGQWGENYAADYLEKKGYSIIERNFRTPVGEIDIVAQGMDGEETFLVFVEVKTRTTLNFGNPEDAVTNQKKQHLLAAIDVFFQENEDRDCFWQIDVIAVQKLSNNQSPIIHHFENVFS